jgi:hypothetical protein
LWLICRCPRSRLIASIGISLVAMLILFLHYLWFLRLYDDLRYTKISIKSQRDLDAYWARKDKSLTEFSRLKRWRMLIAWNKQSLTRFTP